MNKPEFPVPSADFSEFELLEKRIYDLKNLIGLGISLASNLNFESLVESILYSCIGQVFVEKVSILLQVDIDVANFYIHMSKGYEGGLDNSDIILYDGSPLIKYFEKKPYSLTDEEILAIDELRPDYEKLKPLNPKLIVPMKSKNSLNGMIILGDKFTGEDFSDNEKEFLLDLSKFAAIAVENSRLYLMATLDRMTRLYIHHYFQERLHEEMKRSERNSTPLSLIMFDIDHFKKFNDTYGHQQGDLVLKETAKIIKNSIRGIDIAARYGGEEFAVILPETKLEDAVMVAGRLRKNIMDHGFSGQSEPLHVTVSLGVAEYDAERDPDKKSLIERADSALYRAKEAGRNKVVAHTPGGSSNDKC
jgi:diguanylate cyclase (GGDEF)-like protein